MPGDLVHHQSGSRAKSGSDQSRRSAGNSFFAEQATCRSLGMLFAGVLGLGLSTLRFALAGSSRRETQSRKPAKFSWNYGRLLIYNFRLMASWVLSIWEK